MLASLNITVARAKHAELVAVTDDAPAAEPVAVKDLKNELLEVKQMRANVGAVESTLAQEVSLLRETASLQRLSKSARASATTQLQLHETEKFVQSTEAMVVQSRNNAVERARAVLDEALEVKKAADALSTEAKMELKVLGSAHPPAKSSNSDEGMDDVAM